MSILEQKPLPLTSQNVTAFQRFTAGQRWEHALLILSGLVLAITGLPLKYRATDWSQQILATPELVQLFQQIHHIFAVILIVEVLYHMGRAIFLMSQRQQSGEMFPTTQD